MQRLACLAARRELASLAIRWNRNILYPKHETLCQPWWHQRARAHAICVTSPERAWHHLRRRCAQFSGQQRRYNSKDAYKKDSGRPVITVVGTPDPILWIRNKVILFLTELYFGLKFNVEFDNGVKQAAVHVSDLLSKGNFEELRSVMSREAVENIRKKCRALSETQKRQLAISLDDIIFVLPEDVSVFFDQRGRKFIYITMRLWYLSSADVPEDPDGTRIFKIDLTAEQEPQKIITAVYEFYQELSAGGNPEWTVTRLWHWKQLE